MAISMSKNILSWNDNKLQAIIKMEQDGGLQIISSSKQFQNRIGDRLQEFVVLG